MSPTSCRCSTPRRRMRRARNDRCHGGCRAQGPRFPGDCSPSTLPALAEGTTGFGMEPGGTPPRSLTPGTPRATGTAMRSEQRAMSISTHLPSSSSLILSDQCSRVVRWEHRPAGDVGHPHAFPPTMSPWQRGTTAHVHAHRSAPTVARCPRAAASPGGLPGDFLPQRGCEGSSSGGVPT